MNFPIHDWQFLVATALAIGALVWLLRRFLPGRRHARRQARRATLTIEGRAVGAGQPPAAPTNHP
jgi:hypothetical protein